MKDDKHEGESNNFSHQELMEITGTALNELLAQDAFLHDLPKGVTLEEVNNQIALQYGRSITVYVNREDDEVIPVVVPQAEGTVADLKRAIRRFVRLKLDRTNKKKFRNKLISWKYIWRTYYLKHNDTFLKNNNDKLSTLGINNKSQIVFVKKRKSYQC